MDALMMTLGSGWVSGVRPYFMVFLLGLTGRVLDLQQVPAVLQRTDVLVIAGIMLVVDFAADKIPYLDSLWDQVHTVVRPIAGGALGYLLAGETDTVTAIVMAVLGGGMALGSHLTKATTRAAVNVSPEGASNAIVSTTEDVAAVVIGVLTIALPVLAGVVALLLVAAGIYVAIQIHRRIRGLRRRLREAREARAARARGGAAPS